MRRSKPRQRDRLGGLLRPVHRSGLSFTGLFPAKRGGGLGRYLECWQRSCLRRWRRQIDGSRASSRETGGIVQVCAKSLKFSSKIGQFL